MANHQSEKIFCCSSERGQTNPRWKLAQISLLEPAGSNSVTTMTAGNSFLRCQLVKVTLSLARVLCSNGHCVIRDRGGGFKVTIACQLWLWAVSHKAFKSRGEYGRAFRCPLPGFGGTNARVRPGGVRAPFLRKLYSISRPEDGF